MDHNEFFKKQLSKPDYCIVIDGYFKKKEKWVTHNGHSYKETISISKAPTFEVNGGFFTNCEFKSLEKAREDAKLRQSMIKKQYDIDVEIVEKLWEGLKNES